MTWFHPIIIDLIVTTQNTHSHVFGVSHNGYVTMKLLVVDFYSFVPAMLTIMAPPIIMFNPKTLPTYLGG